MSNSSQEIEFANLDDELDKLKANEALNREVKDEFTMPDSYKDKSREELAKMLQDSQSHIGKLGNEVGEVRQMYDQLNARVMTAQAPATLVDNTLNTSIEEDDDLDFFVDPKSAVAKSLSSNPDVKEIKDQLMALKAAEASRTLLSQHPDAAELIKQPEFQRWVEGSSIRKQLFHLAGQQGDLEAGLELLDTYKAIHGSDLNTLSSQAESNLSAAQTPSSSGAGNGSGPSGKIYRSADIRELARSNPKKYYDPGVQAEIKLAYAEGRVQ